MKLFFGGLLFTAIIVITFSFHTPDMLIVCDKSTSRYTGTVIQPSCTSWEKFIPGVQQINLLNWYKLDCVPKFRIWEPHFTFCYTTMWRKILFLILILFNLVFSDIWSLGVILFMLVCGKPPFQEVNDSETLTMIMDCKYQFPPHVSQTCRE